MMKGSSHLFVLSATFAYIGIKTDRTWIVFLLFLGWLVFLYFLRRLSFLLLSVIVISFFLFLEYFPVYTPESYKTPTSSRTVTVEGKIASPVRYYDQSLSFDFILKDTEEKVRVLFSDFSLDSHEKLTFPYTYGARCILSGKWEEVEGATNPFQFDYKQYLFERGIVGQFSVTNKAAVQCVERATFLTKLYSFREQFLLNSERRLHEEIAPWQQALIFGERSALDDEITTLFQRWGLSHLLAISGLHVGILIATIYIIALRFFSLTKEQAQFTLLCFLPIYALLAGSQPSVLRATMMAILILLLKIFQVRLQRLDIVSLAFLTLICIDRTMMFDVGFQFSFLVTFALILSAEWFSHTSSKIMLLFKISFVSQMAIVPLQMYYFYHFQPLSILINILVVPYFSFFVIPFMLIAFFLPYLPSLFKDSFELIFLKVHQFIIGIVKLFDDYVDYPFVSGEITLTIVLLYYAIFIGMMIALEKIRKKEAFFYGIALTMLLTFIIVQPYISSKGSVTMLDIGQGDALVIELPYRRGIFFIDAGATFHFDEEEPRDTIYSRVIRPYLQGRGITKIDAIFVSHPHIDHHGSIRYMLEEVRIDEIFIANIYDRDDPELKKWLKNNETTVSTLKYGDKIQRYDISFTVLSPKKDYKDTNDNSLVLYTKIGPAYMLFTGDISETVEKQIIEDTKGLRVDLLKVAHHGSNTSSAEEFIRSLQPKYAFVPVGKNNRYGHPSKEVIERLDKLGATIYRTDEDGAVQYIYYGEKGMIQPFKSK